VPRSSDAASRYRRLAITGVLVALAAFLIQSVLYVTDVYAFDRSIVLFDLEEGGLVTWATSSAAFAVAFLALFLSAVDTQHRTALILLACTVGFISFDDAAFVHERVALRIAAELRLDVTYVQVIWPVLYLPLLVAVAVLLLQLADDTWLVHRLVVAGLLALATAVALEVVSVALDRAGFDADSWPRVLEITAEEGLELVGWILVATGAAIRMLAVVEGRDETAEVTSP